MNETPLSVRILKLVQQRPGITDSEITSAVGKDVLHQQINQVCHKLKKCGELIRSKRPDGYKTRIKSVADRGSKVSHL